MNNRIAIRIDPNIEKITEILVTHFGHQNLGNKEDPLDELFFIILSSKTPPDRYENAYGALKNAYPDPNDLANAEWTEIANLISKAGLQNRKAKAIVEIAKKLREKFGNVSLSMLADLSDDDAESLLKTLPEVSVKSARCILVYSLDRQLFPVDTHCFRISTRLGWVSGETKLTDNRANELQDSIPPRFRRDLHIGMILLGRQYCRPKNPDCEHCPILDLCVTGHKNLELKNLQT